MSHLDIDPSVLTDRAAQMNNHVCGMVTQSFAGAPAAAQAVAGANRSYLTSLAMMASFAQIAMAVKKLFDRTTEHASLMETTAQQVHNSDVERARRSFNAEALIPTRRSTGGTNVV
jgi:hypothetical protein